MLKHDCPIPGCEARIARTLLMCVDHWLAVPKTLRLRVNREWRNYKRADDDDTDALARYRDAREDAIHAVVSSMAPDADTVSCISKRVREASVRPAPAPTLAALTAPCRGPAT